MWPQVTRNLGGQGRVRYELFIIKESTYVTIINTYMRSVTPRSTHQIRRPDCLCYDNPNICGQWGSEKVLSIEGRYLILGLTQHKFLPFLACLYNVFRTLYCTLASNPSADKKEMGFGFPCVNEAKAVNSESEKNCLPQAWNHTWTSSHWDWWVEAATAHLCNLLFISASQLLFMLLKVPGTNYRG